MKYLIGFFIAIILIAVIGLASVYFGFINVSAADEEKDFVRWVLIKTKENSVENSAEDIIVPNLTDDRMKQKGYLAYQAMCEICHGAPGVKISDLSEGLNPPAPDLSFSVKKWTDAELFWITKNGIKMTGMPAWGKNHSDKEIWNVVAFIKTLPRLSAKDYEKFGERN